MKYPKIYLGIDNCFATKTWTKPETWIKIIKECGLNYIEGSADTECDMLYSDPAYLADWQKKVIAGCNEYGMHMLSVYTGHGTYSTLGLTHTDSRCRERFLTRWMYPHIDNAAALGAHAGFFCHALDDTVQQDPASHEEFIGILVDQLSAIASHAALKGVKPALEQMYTPQHYPWRIKDVYELLSAVMKRSGAPLYITIDTGHQCGQKLFPEPTRDSITAALNGGYDIYTGPQLSYEVFEKAKAGKLSADEAADRILEINRAYPYLFSEDGDSDTYLWLSKLGCYSPIIHLQQTDNNSSSHKDFGEVNNRTGIIKGDKVLKALYECYSSPQPADMPPAVDSIYLTLELFYSAATVRGNIIKSICDSVNYWRSFIPEDGIELDKLVKEL